MSRQAPHVQMPADRLACLDMAAVATQLDEHGAAVLPAMFDAMQCREIADCPQRAGMAGWQPAAGNQEGSVARLSAAALPAWLPAWCDVLRERLQPTADRWQAAWAGTERGADAPAPGLGQAGGSARSAVWTLARLKNGERMGLRQGLDGEESAFPLQAFVLLSAPGEDFDGGEFVMTEQRPRMQSRALVLPLRRGDVAVVAGASRPVEGANGVYRAGMKQGASTVRGGLRLSLHVAWR